MPGLVGYLSGNPNAPAADTIRRMLAGLRPGPGLVTGQVAIPGAGAFGWAVPAGCYADCLPIWNERRDICLLFFGEHFPDRSDIRREAGMASDRSRLGAHWLVHLFELQGDGFFRQLNGVFSGVLIDLRSKEPSITVFNDRHGLNRVYFHEAAAGEFLFASEAKALLSVLPATRRLDPVALAEYVSCGCVLQDRSLYQGVSLLPPASAWTWTPPNAFRRSHYFEPREWEMQSPLPAEEFYARFKEVFTRIVPRYAQALQPVALSITAGVDSRLVLAALHPPAGSLPTYTFGGMYRECADVRFGRQVATAAAQSHQVLSITSEFFSRFTDLAAQSVFLTDGAMDVTGAASLHLNRLARGIAPIRLTGNFGGEVLRGIGAFKKHAVDDRLFDQGLASGLGEAERELGRTRTGHPLSVVAFRQIPWLHFGMYAAESSQVTVRTPFLDQELLALAFRAPAELRLNKSPAFRYIHETDPRLSRVPTDRGTIWSPDASLEARRSRWRWLREEFLPRAEYAFDYGMPHWLARVDRFLSPLHLERLFLGHQKFAHFRLWYRRELAGQVQAILLDPRSMSRSYLDRKRVEEVVAAHVSGRANHTLTLHKLLSLELIQRTLLD